MPLYPQSKRSKPFGQRSTPFDPKEGKYLSLGDPGWVAEFTVVEVGTDMLLCEDRNGVPTLVAKAWAFRMSEQEDEEIPGYVAGEKILAARMIHYVNAEAEDGELTDVEAGEGDEAHTVLWEDLNTAGREAGTPRRAQIVSEGDNTIMVYLYDDEGTLGDEAVEAAKPPGLRRTDYAGLTYDGATYAYVSASSRTADGTAQSIIPSYRAGVDLYVCKPAGGTGVDDVDWQDMNTGQRWWLEAEEE